MDFKQRPTAKTTVSVVQELAPRVGITSEALAKMSIYVDECSDEIGWLGTAHKNEQQNTILIDDVYLFDQDVHGTTTEITPEGLSQFAEELLTMGEEGMEIWNNLRMWGHSHVNMGVTPSGQDNTQMNTFKEGGHEWFIRLIANKQGEMKLDLYDYKHGIIFTDLQWVEVMSDDERQIQDQIDQLYHVLDELQQERVNAYEVAIKEEMKLKVRKMVTTSKYGYWANGKWVPTARTTTTTKNDDEEKKTHGQTSGNDTTANNSNGSTNTDTSTIDREGFYDVVDVFDKDDDVVEQFTNWELIELSDCSTFAELQIELENWGYYNYFTDNDIERIYRVMYKVSKMRGLR